MKKMVLIGHEVGADSVYRGYRGIAGNWRALVDTLRTLPELRLVVMRYPEMKRQHIGEMLWQAGNVA